MHVWFITRIPSLTNFVYLLTDVGADGRMITRFKFTTTDWTAGTVQTDQSRYPALCCILLTQKMWKLLNMCNILEKIMTFSWTSVKMNKDLCQWLVLYISGPFNLWPWAPADQCVWAKSLWICIWLYYALRL